MNGAPVDVLLDVLLLVAVGCVWLGGLGFARLRSARDRLHCAAFVNAGAGIALLSAALVAEGVTPRTLKIAMITTVSLLVGAASSHAVGRMLVVREER